MRASRILLGAFVASIVTLSTGWFVVSASGDIPAECHTQAESLSDARTAYGQNCSLPRIDCDQIDGQWYCSSRVIGERGPSGVSIDEVGRSEIGKPDTVVVAPNPDDPVTPEPAPEPEPTEPTEPAEPVDPEPADPVVPDPGSTGSLIALSTDATPILDTAPSAFGPLPVDAVPSAAPTRFDGNLAGTALPTNQWWSNSLMGDEVLPLFVEPLIFQVDDTGLVVALPGGLVASDRAIIAPRLTAVTIGTAPSSTVVSDYDAFSVELRSSLAQGTATTRVVQGWPALRTELSSGTWPLAWAPGSSAVANGGAVRVSTPEGDWDVFAEGGQLSDDGSSFNAADGASITLVPVPDGAENDAAWTAIAVDIAANPATGTGSSVGMDYEAGLALQELTWDGASVVALLPHHLENLPAADLLGYEFATPRGTLQLVRAGSVTTTTPFRGLVPGVPQTGVSAAVESEVAELVATVTPSATYEAGSYFGPKELGRLATTVELADAVGADSTALVEAVTAGVIDRLTYSGEEDDHWFAYDPSWGGAIAVPPEFGSQDYNDHHFHYGYLLQAAVTAVEHDPSLVDTFGDTIELVIADMIGGATAFEGGKDGIAPLRGFNPYLGHSYAGGFGNTYDGNNQESSSEAVHAWWSIARWGLVTGDTRLTDLATALYAIESESARLYWLGDDRNPRPDGYGYSAAGIVWDGKVDFATWFSGDPAAAVGIQLLPFTFGSLYRNNPASAVDRYADAEGARAGVPDMWVDLMALDLALDDPSRAQQLLDSYVAGDEYEEGNTAAFSRYWIESLVAAGNPSTVIWPDAPVGIAFGGPDGVGDPAGTEVVLTAVNPTDATMTVTFRDQQGRAVSFEVGAGERVVERVTWPQ